VLIFGEISTGMGNHFAVGIIRTSMHSEKSTQFEVFRVFLKLGCTAFGGPVAHLGYFREEFVKRRRWLDDAAYGDLVALCQFLPGPASSQVVFALGQRQAGWLGGLLASLGFTLPSAMLMILFGYGVVALGTMQNAGWLHGLKLAAVAVVAQAVWGMGRNLCPDRARLILVLAAALCVLSFPGAMAQVGVIVGGGIMGWCFYRKSISTSDEPKTVARIHHLIAGAMLILFFLLLALLPMLASIAGRQIQMFDGFYRAGALVFGGGHVVLPMLRAEVVPNGWVTDDVFLAGYGAAQALPGPLFTFAAYLGTVMRPGADAWLGGVWCLIAIFLPSWLLIAGALPFWNSLRTKTWIQAALRGANAAVVGVLLAALYHPVCTTGIQSALDGFVAVLTFALLHRW